MKTATFVVFALSTLAVASAWPAWGSSDEVDHTRSEGSGSSGWQSWNALRDWMSPATNYITQRLPEKTPSQFATDIKEAAVDIRDRAQDHPVVQTVSNVVRPVHEWVKEKATDLSRTSFQDMYDNALGSVRGADKRVAQWFNNRNGEYNALPQAQNIEQLLQ